MPRSSPSRSARGDAQRARPTTLQRRWRTRARHHPLPLRRHRRQMRRRHRDVRSQRWRARPTTTKLRRRPLKHQLPLRTHASVICSCSTVHSPATTSAGRYKSRPPPGNGSARCCSSWACSTSERFSSPWASSCISTSSTCASHHRHRRPLARSRRRSSARSLRSRSNVATTPSPSPCRAHPPRSSCES